MTVSFSSINSASSVTLAQQGPCFPEPEHGKIAEPGGVTLASLGSQQNLSRQDITYEDRHGNDGVADTIVMNIKGHDEVCDGKLMGRPPLMGTIEIDQVNQTVTMKNVPRINGPVVLKHGTDGWTASAEDQAKLRTLGGNLEQGAVSFGMLIGPESEPIRHGFLLDDAPGEDGRFSVTVINDVRDLTSAGYNVDKTTIGVGMDPTVDIKNTTSTLGDKATNKADANNDLKVVRQSVMSTPNGQALVDTWVYQPKNGK